MTDEPNIELWSRLRNSRAAEMAKEIIQPGRRAGRLWEAARQSILERLASAPTEGRLHLELAEHYATASRWFATIAEARTSQALGTRSPEIRDLLTRAHAAIGCALPADGSAAARPWEEPESGLNSLASVVFDRARAIAERCLAGRKAGPMRLLDVGGGEGHLSLFLPQAEYVLAEPSTNGLAGGTLSFPEKSFDLVVSCHVLEHVPEDQKIGFLEELCALARERVVLLGPVADIEIGKELDALAYRLTGALWALEHRDCTAPSLQMLQDFASRRGMRCEVAPNGDMAAVFWRVFAEHFAQAAGRVRELRELDEFSNRNMSSRLSSPGLPNDYFAEFWVG